MKSLAWCLATVAPLLLTPIPTFAADFFLKKNDKVVMIGDSITEQHLHSTYLECWALTRFPQQNLQFINVGIGGDTAPGGRNRFQRDVLPYAPTILTVNFGMNDAGGPGNQWVEERFKNYRTGLQGIADQSKSANIRVVWFTPQPVEIAAAGPSILPDNLNLEKFSAGVKEIAASNGDALFVDQFHPFAAVVDKARQANPQNRIGGGDPVHPGPPGQALMAATLLRGLGFPTLVAATEIDFPTKKIVAHQNCQVDGLVVSPDGKVEFNQLDQSFPFFPEEAKSILPWVSLLDEMNDYRLKVTGLKPGQFEVRLGGVKVGEYSAASLQTGVNLAAAALSKGPIAEQIKSVWTAVKNKNQYFHDKIFAGVLRAGGVPDFLEITPAMLEEKRQAAFKQRMEKMPELYEAIKTSLIISPHHVEILPIQSAADASKLPSPIL